MGPKLRAFVERKLVEDLNYYTPSNIKYMRDDVVFDWSESCIEGHRTGYLDGEVENFSGISLLDLAGSLIAEGWMEFIETQNDLKVFWSYLDGGEAHSISAKRENKIPTHVWETLREDDRRFWANFSPDTSKSV